jgi:hypothetical protein
MTRSITIALGLALAAACDKEEPPPPPETQTQPPEPAPEPEPATPEPATPEPATPEPAATAPSIDLDALLNAEDAANGAVGFPAKSGDRLAIAIADSDGGRGNPNLTIRIANAATGATVEDHVVLTADEFEQHNADAAALRTLVDGRLPAVRTALEGFSSLEAIGLVESLEANAGVHLEGAGLALGFAQDDGHLLIRRPGGAVLHESEIADGEGTGNEEECGDRTHGPALRGAWKVDDTHVLLHVSYFGGDVCPEPDDTFPIVELSATDGRAAFLRDATPDCARLQEGAYRAELASSGIDLANIACDG